MQRHKRVAALILSAAMLVFLLTGCIGNETGLSLSVCVGSKATTLDPIYAEDIESQTVLAHLYENLMRITPDSSGGTAVVNGMAKEIASEKNADGTVTYTFHLRNAKWSDGKKVRAEDFVYAWQRLADPSSHSPHAALLSVVCGYAEARAQGDMSLLQISAKNDTTLSVTLNGNYDWFLSEVCTSPATMPLRRDVVQSLKASGTQADDGSKTGSWWADPTALVTNGPYIATASNPNSLQLSANDRYHSEQFGPVSITFCYAASAESAQALYADNAVDAVWPLTDTRMAELVATVQNPVPQLHTYAVVYNCANSLFADPLLRQAVALTIDRVSIAEQAGVGAIPSEGLVPPGVPENEEGDFRTLASPLLDNDPECCEENRQLARELLSNAGYDSGAALGALEYLYADEGSNGEIAQLLCQQWQESLGVQVTPKGVTFQELWATLRAGNYTLAGVDLEALGNDAECFLMNWTSRSYNNVAGYENSAYDTLMSIVAGAAAGTARMGCLHDAEALLLGDYALSPLYTKGTAWELRENLTGAARDARGWFCFSNVTERTL